MCASENMLNCPQSDAPPNLAVDAYVLAARFRVPMVRRSLLR